MSKYTVTQKLAFSLLGVKNNNQKELIILLSIIDVEDTDKEIILSILNGEEYIKSDVSDYFCKYYESKNKFFQTHKCTDREIEIGKICILAQKGFSQKKIAEYLGLSNTQVNTRCKKYGIITVGMKK